MSKYIAIKFNGELTIHATASHGNYATLCGADGDDPVSGQEAATVPKGRKINCKDCRALFDAAHALKKSDFEI